MLSCRNGVTNCTGSDGADDGEHTMVKVLCSQRDRFKERAHQLEVQLAEVCCFFTQARMLSTTRLFLFLILFDYQAGSKSTCE